MPFDKQNQLGSEPDETMKEGFGSVATTLVICAILMGCAVIWSMCK